MPTISTSELLKAIITNPVHKCVKGNHNPFTLLPIYENSDLFEEVKIAYREAIEDAETRLAMYDDITLNKYDRSQIQKLSNRLDNINKYFSILEEFSVDLPADELMTYQLL